MTVFGRCPTCFDIRQLYRSGAEYECEDCIRVFDYSYGSRDYKRNLGRPKLPFDEWKELFSDG